MKFFAEVDQESLDVTQGVDHFHLVFDRLRVMAQHFLGALQGESLFFYKMIYCADVVDILSGKLPVTLSVLFWLDDIEFRFPETD